VRWYQSLAFVGIYSLVYLVLVFGTFADGHGTFVFASPLFTWLLFILAFFLIRYCENKLLLTLVLVCIALHYVASIFIGIIEESGDANFERTIVFMYRNPPLFIATVAWYIAGQIIFWILLIRCYRRYSRLN